MIIPANSNMGKITPANMPDLRLSPCILDTNPTKVSPPVHPTSPPNAKSANMAVPPLESVAAALLNVPGHIIPTDNPQMEQAIKLICGEGTREIHR